MSASGSKPSTLPDGPSACWLLMSTRQIRLDSPWCAAASPPPRSNLIELAVRPATQGLGVALESATIAGQHLADGKLRAVFGLEMAVKLKAHFAVYPARHARRPAVQAFLAWLHAEAARS